MLFMILLFVFFFYYSHNHLVNGTQSISASNTSMYLSVNTDRAKYSIGHDVTILGNVTDGLGNKAGAIVILEISHVGGPAQTYVSTYARNGSFYYKVPIIDPIGKYNVTALIPENRGKATASFEVLEPPIPVIAIITGVLSLAGFISVLIIPLSKVKDGILLSQHDSYVPEVIRFLSLSGIALTPFAFFIYADLEFGINSPIGLVIKDSSGATSLLTQWVINVGGNKSDSYSSELQIPFYVFAFGIAGGYLRYLYKAAFKYEHKAISEPERVTKQEFMWQTIGELAEIVLSPFLAVAAWFLLSVAGTPNIYTAAVVSFTVGLATKDIVERLINYTTTELKAGKNKES